MNNITELTGPDIEWENNGNEDAPEAFLTAWVRILNQDFHASAIQVDSQGNAIMYELQEDLDRLQEINGSCGEPFLTVAINGLDYVVFFHPFTL